LGSLKTLDADTARALGNNNVLEVDVGKLASIDADTAAVISKWKCDSLSLTDLETLNDDAAL